MTVIYNNDLSSLTDLTLLQTKGTVTQVTQDGRECAKLVITTAGASSVVGMASVDYGSNIGIRKLSIVQYLDGLGSITDKVLYYIFRLGTQDVMLLVGSAGLYSYDKTTKLCDLPMQTWHTIDIYLDMSTPTAPKVNYISINGALVLSTQTNITPYASSTTNGIFGMYIYSLTTAPAGPIYIDSVTITDDEYPCSISGTLKEKESDAAGSPEHYLIINSATGAVLAAGTAGADGSFTSPYIDNTTEYALIMPDKDGAYAPTCLNHYITEV